MSDTFPNALSLAQLLCTRLCHDLAGPIGAVAAGVELTGGDPAQVDAETLGLIGNSSAAASRKLKFLRAALGMPGAASAVIGELSGLVEAYLSATAGRGGPPALNWPAVPEISAVASALGPAAVPLILNLCLLVLETQPACRRLTLSLSTTPGVCITVTAEGESPRGAEWRAEIAGAVNGDGVAATAKTVQAHFLKVLAGAARGAIYLSTEGQTASASFQVA